MVAEASAFRDAIILAANLGWERIHLESDCLQLIDACNLRRSIGEIQIIVNDIVRLKRNFSQCNFTWIPRRINQVAHILAQLHSRNCLPYSWWHSPHRA